jgi:hypothetical protein
MKRNLCRSTNGGDELVFMVSGLVKATIAMTALACLREMALALLYK